MIPFKPHSLTAVPRIAQVQSEIAKAVVVLASQYVLGNSILTNLERLLEIRTADSGPVPPRQLRQIIVEQP
jgi:hypothetical protein